MTAAKSPRTVLVWLTAAVLTMVLRIWCWSLRKDTNELQKLERLISAEPRILVVFWHGKYLPLFALAEGLHATVFAGKSFRGEVVAEISRRFGFDPQVIPANRNGRSLDFMRAAFASAKVGALAVDGPLGPYHAVSAGTIKLASELGLLVVPVSVASKPMLVLTKRWDQRELPLPFSRLVLTVGDAFSLPGAGERLDFPKWANAIRQALEEADDQAARQLRQRDPSDVRAR